MFNIHSFIYFRTWKQTAPVRGPLRCAEKAPAVKNFAWLPVGAVATKNKRSSVSLIQARP